MANRDLLADAIADAKAVKEVAIANAKAALEEAFTPHLKDMLAQKINEMEDLEETELSEVDKEKQEEAEMKKEGYGKKYEAKEEIKEEELEEELDLEEILAELELEEEDLKEEELEEYGGNIDPGTEPKSFLKKKPDSAQLEEGEVEEGKEEMEEGKEEMEEAYDDQMEEAEDMEGEMDDAEINLEDMSEDELKTMIEDVIEDMIEDGELVPGPNADESEEEEMEDTDDGMEGDADVDIEVDNIDLQEGEEVNEAIGLAAGLAIMAKGIAALGGTAAAANALEKYAEKKPDSAVGKLIRGIQKVATGTTKAVAGLEETVEYLRSELNEVNLLNSKLLYTNKIFKGKNLTENQKIKVLKAFDKAETVKEAKRIFETLNENLVTKTKKSNIRESLGAASKPAGVAPKRPITENVVQEDAMVNRFKQLAGIK